LELVYGVEICGDAEEEHWVLQDLPPDMNEPLSATGIPINFPS